MYLNYSSVSAYIEKCGMHTHDHFEVCMNLEGETLNYLDGEATLMKQGDIFICAPGVPHGKEALTGNFKDTYINFSCDGIFPKDFKGGYYEDSDGAVMKLLDIMHKLYNSNSSEKRYALNSLAESVCYIIKGKSDNKIVLSPAVDMLKSSIIENFTNPEYKISDTKEYRYYNKDYMRQIFKKEMGLSPLDYLNELRLSNAIKLLSGNREPQYMINEISFLCGFYDVGYFTRMFRKKYGKTPSEYRKSILEQQKPLSQQDICCKCTTDCFPESGSEYRIET